MFKTLTDMHQVKVLDVNISVWLKNNKRGYYKKTYSYNFTLYISYKEIVYLHLRGGQK